MAKITIVGAGVTGLAIASQLARLHEVTIVARNLPGDELGPGWASPWAGACLLPLDGSTPAEQKMQRDAFAFMWRLSASNPESSVRRIEMLDYQDDTPLEKIWYQDFMPNFRVLPPDELPAGAKLGMSYMNIVITPTTFLPWMRRQLEASGVKFKRMELRGLRDLKSRGQDIIINATGWGAKFLSDVADPNVQQVRGQTLVVKTDFNKIFMRHGKDYTYVIPRLDGTAILGGIKQVDNVNTAVDHDIKLDIVRPVHENLPHAFPADISKYEIVRDNVGIRPARVGGVRVEKEVMDGQKVVHAYGTGGGGYVFSFGIGKAVRELVDEFIYTLPLDEKLEELKALAKL